jgi:YVTN family beta-propeller protein
MASENVDGAVSFRSCDCVEAVRLTYPLISGPRGDPVRVLKVEVRRRLVVFPLALALVAAVAAVGLAAGTASASSGSSGSSARPSHDAAEIHLRSLQGSHLRSDHGGGGSSVPVGLNPFNSALNPATHTLYVTNFGGNAGTVSVLDAATCNALDTRGCDRTPPTVQVGSSPVGLAIDLATDTIYVTNFGNNTVSVINGATCNAENTSGCGQSPPTVAVGFGPTALDVNQKTDTVYVANQNSQANGGGFGLGTTVSVIDGATCNAENTSGCGQTPPTVAVATGPEGVIVDPSTDTTYVGSQDPNGVGAVSVINGATCNATVTSGCDQTPPMVSVGSGTPMVLVALAIDQANKTLYVANYVDNTLSMINKATCNAIVTSGCGRTPKVVSVGTPDGISLNDATDTIYVSKYVDDALSVLDPATCNAIVTSGCARVPGVLRTGAGPLWVTSDPSTDTIYVPNSIDNTVSVLSGATCNVIVTSGCTRFPPTVRAGSGPVAAVVDQATDTVYVPNSNDNTVSVVNGATCNANVRSGCGQSAATMTVGAFPYWAALDSATDTLYVANDGDNTVSVVDTATCNAIFTFGCGRTPPTVAVGNAPDGLAVDQQTDTVYVSNYNDNTVSIIDGATCNASVTSGCGQTAPTVAVGAGPSIPAVNQATDTVYVPNFGGNTVSIIDGVTCNATVTSGCGQTPPTVTVGTNPDAVAVDPYSHTVYVVNSNYTGNYSGSVSVINSATCNAQVSSGCGQTPPTVTVGTFPQTLAISLATSTIFVANYFGDSVSVIDGAACNATITAGCGGTPATIEVGGLPLGPAVNEATGTVYVPNSADNNMSVFGFRCPTAPARTPSPR